MNMTRWTTLCIALLSFAVAEAALPTEIGGQPFPSLAPLVQEAQPAVVNIRVSQNVARRSPFMRGGEVASAGSVYYSLLERRVYFARREGNGYHSPASRL